MEKCKYEDDQKKCSTFSPGRSGRCVNCHKDFLGDNDGTLCMQKILKDKGDVQNKS